MINRDKLYFRIFCILFWVMAVSNFVLDEFIPAIGESGRDPINSILNALFLVFGLLTLRKKSDGILIGVFIFLGITSSIINAVPTGVWFNDLRRVVPTFLVLPVVRYFFTCEDSEHFRESFDKQLKIFLILQAFALTEQFLRYGANDHGGGTLGNWNSGNISLSIILISFYFVCKNWDGENYLSSLWNNRLYVFLLFPVFLNETKVSFLVLAFYFILLFPFNIRSVGKLLIAIPVAIIMSVGLIAFYMWAIDARDDVYAEGFIDTYLTGGNTAGEIMEDAAEAVDFVEELVNQVDEGEWLFLDVPRFMKLGLIPSLLEDAKGGYLLGAGLGHLADFTHPTKFTNEHMIALFGTRTMVHYNLFPLGILGLIWAFFWYKNILSMSSRPLPMSMRVKLMLLTVIILTFFYNEYFNLKIGCIIFYFICLSNTYPLKKDEKNPKGDTPHEPNLIDNSSSI